MRYTAVIRQERGLFVSWCPDLDVASQGADAGESLQNLKEAVEQYLEDEHAPRPTRMAIVTSFEVDAPPRAP